LHWCLFTRKLVELKWYTFYFVVVVVVVVAVVVVVVVVVVRIAISQIKDIYV
jgi:hypothetical protein